MKVKESYIGYILAFLAGIIAGSLLISLIVADPGFGKFLPERERLAREELSKGEVLFAQTNDPKRALFYYNKAVTLWPKYADAYHKIGMMLNLAGRHEDAIEYYKKAIDLDYLNSHESFFNLGIAYKNLGLYEAAIDAFKKAIGEYPDYCLCWQELADTYKKLNKIDLFEESLRRASLCLIKAGEEEKGSELLRSGERTLEAERARGLLSLAGNIPAEGDTGSIPLGDPPNDMDAEVCFKFGVMLSEMGRHEEAINYYKKAIKSDYMGSHELFFNMGMAYEQIGQYEEAADAFNKAIEGFPDYSPYWQELISVYKKLDKLDLINDALQRAGLNLIKMGKEEEVKKLLKLVDSKLKKENEVSPSITGGEEAKVYFKLGTMLSKMEKYEEAIKAYDNAIMARGNLAPYEYFYNRSLAYKNLYMTEKAIADMEEAIRKNVDSPSLHRELANLFLALGENKKAASEYYLAGTLFLGEGKAEIALSCFMVSKSLSPDIDISFVEKFTRKKE